MTRKKSKSLQDNFLTGRPEDTALYAIVRIAQEVISQYKLTENDVLNIASDVLKVMEQWQADKQALSSGSSELGNLLSDETDPENPWYDLDLPATDLMEYFIELRNRKYEPLENLVAIHGNSCIVSALILIDASRPSYSGLLTRVSDSVDIYKEQRAIALKGLHELVFDSMVNVKIGAAARKFFTSYLKPNIDGELLREASVRLSKLGGNARAVYFAELSEFCINMFNDHRFRSMAEGAREIANDLVDHDKKLKHMLITREPERRVYSWLRKANKEGLLYKRF